MAVFLGYLALIVVAVLGMRRARTVGYDLGFEAGEVNAKRRHENEEFRERAAAFERGREAGRAEALAEVKAKRSAAGHKASETKAARALGAS